MPTTLPNQKIVPAPGDAPARAAFDQLANSINDILIFDNQQTADAWVSTNPDLAVNGKTATIAGFLHYLSGDVWVLVGASYVKAATAAAAAAASVANPTNIYYWVG
jgi:hypothetical protein